MSGTGTPKLIKLRQLYLDKRFPVTSQERTSAGICDARPVAEELRLAFILVIDSEDTVRTVMASILERAGHSVRACAELREALAVVSIAEPDLILTNVYLRDSTGHDALSVLREELPDVPVLMVSGLPDEDVIHQWQEERRFDVFPKPFTADSLTTKVSEILAA